MTLAAELAGLPAGYFKATATGTASSTVTVTVTFSSPLWVSRVKWSTDANATSAKLNCNTLEVDRIIAASTTNDRQVGEFWDRVSGVIRVDALTVEITSGVTAAVVTVEMWGKRR